MNLIIDNASSLVLFCSTEPIAAIDGSYAIGEEKIGISPLSASVVLADSAPQYFYPQVYTYIGGVWSIVDQERYNICYDQERDTHNAKQKAAREAAYRAESDPLFFKAQRVEANREEWLAKVEEIKARYPYKS